MLWGFIAAFVLAQAPAVEGAHELRHDWAIDGAVTGIGWAAWASTETVFKKPLAPASCRWCDRAPDGRDTLNALDAWGRGLRWSPERLLLADMLSNVAAFGVLPIAVLGLDIHLASGHEALWAVPVDALIVVQSALFALTLNQFVKFAVGRERPFVHVLPEEQKALTRHPSDNNLSFFSGHTTFAFSIAVATATVAELRGYRRAWLAWAVGLPLAATAPLLRMAADRHYLSDVLVGAAVGTAFGCAVPRLLHPRTDVLERTSRPWLRFAPALGGAIVWGEL